jgi:hypothetical protein
MANSGGKSSVLGKIKKVVVQKQAGSKRHPEENQISQGTDAGGKKTEPKIESRNREQKSQYKITQNKNTTPRSTTSRNTTSTNGMQNSFFSIEKQKIILDPRRTPSSLSHLIIRIKICLLHTTLNLEMQMTIREVVRIIILVGSYL